MPDFPRPAGTPAWQGEAEPRECKTGETEQVFVINGSRRFNFDGSLILMALE